MKLRTNAWRDLDWTPQFWRFAVSYFLLPGVGLRSSLSMTWSGGEHMNVVFRLMNLFVNWALFALLMFATLSLIHSLATGQWASGIALQAAAPILFAVLVIRLQMVFRLRGQYHAEGVR